MNRNFPLDLIRTILIEELNLPGNRVTIYNQKFIIPNTDGLFIYLENKGTRPVISSRNRMTSTQLGAQEEQDLNVVENIVIGMYSRNLEALDRNEEAVMALHSIFSQQLQEKYSFKIFRNAPITAIEEFEGTARLYRFDIEVKMFFAYSKTKTAEFYDSHSVEVFVEDGNITEVEFVIPDSLPK